MQKKSKPIVKLWAYCTFSTNMEPDGHHPTNKYFIPIYLTLCKAPDASFSEQIGWLTKLIKQIGYLPTFPKFYGLASTSHWIICIYLFFSMWILSKCFVKCTFTLIRLFTTNLLSLNWFTLAFYQPPCFRYRYQHLPKKNTNQSNSNFKTKQVIKTFKTDSQWCDMVMQQLIWLCHHSVQVRKKVGWYKEDSKVFKPAGY